MLQKILTAFNIDPTAATVQAFGNGLINNTWLVKNEDNSFILQRINNSVFKHPEHIAENIKNIAHYFAELHPGYLFVNALQTKDKHEMLATGDEGYFRMFPYIQNSHTIDVVSTAGQAFEAAKQFGRFTALLKNFYTDKLKITLPDFHNLTLRYKQFEAALSAGNKERINNALPEISYLKSEQGIAATFEKITTGISFKKRVTHHDTKISNVLLSSDSKGLCVIDLDTVMPGYFISDVGDMMRTYLSPVSEEEKDYSKIRVREDFFKAIARGYLGQMKDQLSAEEINHFVYAGKFMIYMQALRFLTDYINDDVYYGSRYKGQNYVRAQNQICLMKKYIDKENLLQSIVNEIMAEAVSC